MFSGIKRWVLLVVTVSAVLGGAPVAQATTIVGGGSFVANAGASRVVITSGSGIPLDCTASGLSGTVNDTTAPVAPPARIGQVTLTFNFCIGPAGLAFTRVCSPANLNVTGPTVAGTTPGSITGINCTTTFVATGCKAYLTGSVQVSYTNPTGGINGKLVVLTVGQSLTVSGSGCPSWVPNGASDYGRPAGTGTGLADLTYTLSTAGPTIS